MFNDVHARSIGLEPEFNNKRRPGLFFNPKDPEYTCCCFPILICTYIGCVFYAFPMAIMISSTIWSGKGCINAYILTFRGVVSLILLTGTVAACVTQSGPDGKRIFFRVLFSVPLDIWTTLPWIGVLWVEINTKKQAHMFDFAAMPLLMMQIILDMIMFRIMFRLNKYMYDKTAAAKLHEASNSLQGVVNPGVPVTNPGMINPGVPGYNFVPVMSFTLPSIIHKLHNSSMDITEIKRQLDAIERNTFWLFFSLQFWMCMICMLMFLRFYHDSLPVNANRRDSTPSTARHRRRTGDTSGDRTDRQTVKTAMISTKSPKICASQSVASALPITTKLDSSVVSTEYANADHELGGSTSVSPGSLDAVKRKTSNWKKLYQMAVLQGGQTRSTSADKPLYPVVKCS